MLRGFSIFGLGGGFLMISPKLRMSVQSGLDSGLFALQLHAPWSYCGLVLMFLVFVAVTLYRGAQPR
jgi:hypothetical protein